MEKLAQNNAHKKYARFGSFYYMYGNIGAVKVKNFKPTPKKKVSGYKQPPDDQTIEF